MSIPKIPSYQLPKLTELVPNKVNWQPDTNRCALLIHDMQQYFIDFYGENNAAIEQVIANMQQIKQFCRQHQIPVFYTAQPAQQPAQDRALLNDMWGAGLTKQPQKQAIIDALAADSQDIVLDKWRYSAFQRSDFAQQLAQLNKDQLIICGVYANIGCLSTATEAFMRDIQPFMLADAVADFSRAEHINALNYVATKVGVVLTTAQLLATKQG